MIGSRLLRIPTTSASDRPYSSSGVTAGALEPCLIVMATRILLQPSKAFSYHSPVCSVLPPLEGLEGFRSILTLSRQLMLHALRYGQDFRCGSVRNSIS